MGERLIPKLDRLGAEAGIKQMTPEIYNFALLVRADVVAQWPERPWVGLTDEERDRFVYIDEKDKKRFRKYGAEIEQLLKEKNS
jgi:hypothetical protein